MTNKETVLEKLPRGPDKSATSGRTFPTSRGTLLLLFSNDSGVHKWCILTPQGYVELFFTVGIHGAKKLKKPFNKGLSNKL